MRPSDGTIATVDVSGSSSSSSSARRLGGGGHRLTFDGLGPPVNAVVRPTPPEGRLHLQPPPSMQAALGAADVTEGRQQASQPDNVGIGASHTLSPSSPSASGPATATTTARATAGAASEPLTPSRLEHYQNLPSLQASPGDTLLTRFHASKAHVSTAASLSPSSTGPAAGLTASGDSSPDAAIHATGTALSRNLSQGRAPAVAVWAAAGDDVDDDASDNDDDDTAVVVDG